MQDSPIKSSDEEMNDLFLRQAEELLKNALDADKTFRELLQTHWKDKKMVGEISDGIHYNMLTIEALQNEIKDRNSKFPKK